MDHSLFKETSNFVRSLHSQEYPRLATTRKLLNMNEHKRSTSGIIQLNLLTSDNHLTIKSRSSNLIFLIFQ